MWTLEPLPPFVRATPGYFMLSASVWSIIYKWLIRFVLFHLEYSQQGGLKENRKGQQVQGEEHGWWSASKRLFPEVMVFNITPLCIDALAVFVAHSFNVFSASISFIVSFTLRLFLLPHQSFIVLPVCRGFVKYPEKRLFYRSLVYFLTHHWFTSRAAHDDKQETNEGKKGEKQTNKIHIILPLLSCVSGLARLYEQSNKHYLNQDRKVKSDGFNVGEDVDKAGLRR